VKRCLSKRWYQSIKHCYYNCCCCYYHHHHYYYYSRNNERNLLVHTGVVVMLCCISVSRLCYQSVQQRPRYHKQHVTYPVHRPVDLRTHTHVTTTHYYYRLLLLLLLILLQWNLSFGEMLDGVQESMLKSDKIWCTVHISWLIAWGYRLFERPSYTTFHCSGENLIRRLSHQLNSLQWRAWISTLPSGNFR